MHHDDPAPPVPASARMAPRRCRRCRALRTAQAYPSRPVRIIVGFAAGGPTDILARLIGAVAVGAARPAIRRREPAGAGGNIGTEAVVNAPAGRLHAAAWSAPANTDQRDALRQAQLQFHPRHRAGRRHHPHAQRHGGATRRFRRRRFRSSSPTPRPIPASSTMASAGTGTPQHVAGELFKMMAGVDMVHVPYRGAAPALDRPDRRAGAGHVRHHADVDRIHQGRQAARAGGDDRDALGRRCRTSRPSAISCRATRRARGSASARRGTRRPRSSTRSTARSTPASPIPRSRRGSTIGRHGR